MSAVLPSRLFVETTIYIWRHTATNAAKRRINDKLNSAHCVTSTYVQAEYINTYARAAVEAYNCIVASEDYQDAFGRWESYYASQYKLGVRFLVDAIFRDNNEKEAALRRLKELIEHRLLLPFHPRAQTFEVIDSTRCAAAHVRPYMNGNVYILLLDFPPPVAPSGLQNFLEQKRPLLMQIEAAITSNDKHWRMVKRGLQMLLAGEYNLGLRKWQKIADVVIALEAHHASCEIYTGNVQHFEVICGAIQLPLKPEKQQ